MKKLLTTITLSALVGTSTSNLKPLFTNTNVNNNLKLNQINHKDISIKNQNGGFYVICVSWFYKVLV